MDPWVDVSESSITGDGLAVRSLMRLEEITTYTPRQLLAKDTL